MNTFLVYIIYVYGENENNHFRYFFNIKQLFAFKFVKVIGLIIIIEFNPQYQTFEVGSPSLYYLN